MSNQRHICWLIVGLTVLLTGGCGGPVQSSVSGKVTSGGAAVSGARINFIEAKSATAASAELGPSGEYSIPQGLPPGMYKVFVTVSSSASRPPMPGESPAAAPQLNIPPQYTSDATSPLNYEVKAGDNKGADFKLD
jgi:hypothetical protein